MSRLLFWIALAILVVAAVRSKLRQAAKRHQQMSQPMNGPDAHEQLRPQPARAAAKAEAETMLCCAHCGVYFPASENVPAGGRDYCSAAHSQLAPQ
ncbi:hypothetical protein GCM10027277_17760 [Pseudoduganella ginsengisoli]|uniref:Deaminase n=1 Tax=Pseudoduganella ginsengisoli TaxID=1462440 RepID=A0A6L6PU26_9BURK|nr:PP0621 family protein [Pseudoduganella ginsengisoli]MTW00967.1 hypothetical protein [Pseudoduganella ginsengisoli]